MFLQITKVSFQIFMLFPQRAPKSVIAVVLSEPVSHTNCDNNVKQGRQNY